MRKFIILSLFIPLVSICACKKKDSNPDPAATPTPTEAAAPQTTVPVTTPAQTPVVTTPILSTPAPTPTTSTGVPAAAVVTTVPLDPVTSAPIIPNTPTIPQAHFITVTGQVVPVDINLVTASCQNLNVSAYYVPCVGNFLCGARCGYFIN